jgi:hypothetical protein
MDKEQRIALAFIRNIAQRKTTRPNDIWSTIYHVAQDALNGHTHTIDDLRATDEYQSAE